MQAETAPSAHKGLGWQPRSTSTASWVNYMYVISVCSCGGKTTLINTLASRGYSTYDEPGPIIVREELNSGGNATVEQSDRICYKVRRTICSPLY